MLAPDFRFEGFDTADWTRLIELLGPADAAPRPRSGGGIVAVTRGDRLVKLLATDRGRLDPREQAWPVPLEDLARERGAHWGMRFRVGALDEAMERFAVRLRREQGMMQQGIELLEVFRELESEGAVELWPWRLGSWPVPSDKLLGRALDVFCADGKSIVVGVFERGELHTCIAARRKGLGFDHIVGPQLLRSQMGLVAGDWRRDYRHLVRAVEQRMGDLSLGCFAERSTLRSLAERPLPGAWTTAVAARDVVLAPAPPGIAIPLSYDAGRAALATVRDVIDRMSDSGWLSDDSPLGPVLSRVRRVASDRKDLEQLLGFDPLELLRKLLQREPR